MLTYNKSISLQLAMAVDQAYQKYQDPSHIILIPGYVLKDEIYLWESRSGGKQFLGFSAQSTDGSNDAMLVFRGTTTIVDDIMDREWAMRHCEMNGQDYGNIAEGWYNMYCIAEEHGKKTVQQSVQYALGNLDVGGVLRIAGHSQGCAVASLAYLDIASSTMDYKPAKMEMYTFGSPYIGDETFANSFDQFNKRGDIFRVYNLCDSVPSFSGLSLVPNRSFKHIGEDCSFIWQTGYIIDNHSLEKTYLKVMIKDMTMPGYVNLGKRAQPVPPC